MKNESLELSMASMGFRIEYPIEFLQQSGNLEAIIISDFRIIVVKVPFKFVS